jgi:hypothetical protein
LYSGLFISPTYIGRKAGRKKGDKNKKIKKT